MKDQYIGVDVGTESARVCVVDEHGSVLAHCSKSIERWSSSQGFVEQSTTNIWNCICQCVHHVLSQPGVCKDNVKGIGFAATCSLAVFDVGTGQPLSMTVPTWDGDDHNVILWLDERGEEEVAAVNQTQHPTLRYLGGAMVPEMHVSKVLWLKKHMPAETFARCKFYDLSDALDFIATGLPRRDCNHTTDLTKAVSFGIDGTVKGWQRDFWETLGLSQLADDGFKQIGGVCQHGRSSLAGLQAGQLCASAAAELGLPEGIAVSSGVIDAFAGWIGTTGAAMAEDNVSKPRFGLENRIALVAGTSTCMIAHNTEPTFVKGIWGPYQDLMIPGYYMAEGGQSATGHLLKYIIETHPAYSTVAAECQVKNRDMFDYLNDALESMQAQSSCPSISHLARYLFFYGDLYGNRTPIADPKMAGSVVGLRADKSPENLALTYYAALEFLALQTKHIITTMNDAGFSIRSIFMSGSQCRNGLLVGLIATVCNMPVVIPENPSVAVSLGAALLGACAADSTTTKHGRGLWSIMMRLSKPGKIVEPTNDDALGKLLAVKYKVYLELCERQQVYRKMIDEVT